MRDPALHPKPLLDALARTNRADTAPESVPEVELFRLRIGQTAFAIEAGLIQEVVRAPPMTPLPGAPAFLTGVAAHRGEVVAIVDLARLLGRGQTRVGARSRMAISRAGGMVVALLADEMRGLVRVPSTALQPAPLGADDAEFTCGVVAGDEPMYQLDLRRALAAARERACARR